MNFFRSLKYRLWGESAGFGKPVPKEAFERDYASGKWDFLAEGEEARRLQAIATIIEQRWSHPAILDIGCGAGFFARALQTSAPSRLLGVDLSGEAIKRARLLQLTNARFEVGDFNLWSASGERFDVITFVESIGYAEDPRAMLTRFRASLTPDGQMLVSLFRWGNSAQIWARIQRDFEVTYETVLSAPAKEWDVRLLKPKQR